MIPPPIASYTTPHTGGIIPGDDLLPDDWDKDLLEGIGAPQPAAPPAAQPVAPPVSRQVPDLARPAAPPPMPAAAPEPIPAPDPIAAFEASSSFESPVPFEAPSSFEAHAPFDEEITPFAPPAVESLGGSPLEHSAPPQPMVGSGIEAAGQAPSPVAAPVVRQRPPRPVAPPPAAVEANPFSEPDLDPLKDVPPFAASAPLAFDSGGDASPFDEPSDMPKAAPAAIPTAVPMAAVAMAAVPIAAAAAVAASAPALARTVPPAPVASGDGDGRALVAFFQGAELTGAVPADPLAMMKGLGAAFRSVVAGLRSVLIARATIKNEFRIEQTMIRAHGNNPLKFSANDDDALTALLGVGRRTDMTPAAAIDDALRDIRMHEVATMAAMQVAVRSILDELSPDNIRAGTEQGGLAILPAQRKARAWDVFEARHTATVTALADDFDSVFGKAFARAYERALSEISTREQR
ncbi:MAG: type VI secretion system-associated FHA domain protein TagH [Acetobacteraceae bacterium]|nr:type VI secretion system-associated FHA domain protein TagH [Acetobacteraceae bacterium]